MDMQTLPSDSPLYFMHIQKTGGTSLRQFLFNHFAQNEIYEINLASFTTQIDQQTVNLKDLSELESVKKLDLTPYPLIVSHAGWILLKVFNIKATNTFTFLRNPIDTILSMYKYMHQQYRQNHLFNLALKKWPSFEAFILDPALAYYISNPQAKHFCTDYFFIDHSLDASLKQLLALTWHIRLPNPEMKSLASNRLQQCAFIGITEHYGKSLQQFCQKFKWYPPHTIPHVNISENIITKKQIGTEVYNKLLTFTEIDFALYEEALQIQSQEKNRKFFIFTNQKPNVKIENVSLSQTKVITTAEGLLFPFSHGLCGTGWDSRENNEQVTFRWTTEKTAYLLLPFLLKSNEEEYEVIIHAPYSLQIKSKKHLKVTMNGIKIKLHCTQDPKTNFLIFNGQITKKILQKTKDRLHLTFTTPKLIRPSDYNKESTDKRKLGIAISAIEVKRKIL